MGCVNTSAWDKGGDFLSDTHSGQTNAKHCDQYGQHFQEDDDKLEKEMAQASNANGNLIV